MTTPPTKRASRRAWLAMGAVAAAAGTAGVVVSNRRMGRSTPESLSSLDAFWSLVLPHAQTGQPVALAEFRRAGLVLNFWATWCAPCVREFPALDRFSRHPDVTKDWRVLGLAIDQPAPVQQFLRQHGVSFTNVVGGVEGLAWSKVMGNHQGGLPYTVFIKDGRVIATLRGEASDESLMRQWRVLAG